MVVSIQVEPATGMAIATCSGVVGRADAQQGAASLWETPGWPGKSVVWDFREARFDVTSSDIWEVAQFVARHQPDKPPSRVAFVTSRDVDFGSARVFEAFREDPRTEFRVFRDYEEAVRWARLPEPGSA